MAGQPEAAVVLRTPEVTIATAVCEGCAMVAPSVGPMSGHSVLEPEPVDTLCLLVLPRFCHRNLKPSALSRLLVERGSGSEMSIAASSLPHLVPKMST